MNIAVVVASKDRAEEIGQLLHSLERQSLQPSAVILSVEKMADLPSDLPKNVQVIVGPCGSSAQRNRGLELAVTNCDAVVFFDDDFLPTKDSLFGISRLFELYPDIVCATGVVLHDGVKEGGFGYDAAVKLLHSYELRPITGPIITKVTMGTYGCNMAFRAMAIIDIRFDENLPLYGWQEDMDFAARAGRFGKIVKTNAFAGVHRGVNKGRSPGEKLGYSQMVNPVYLVRKGTMRLDVAAHLMIKNFLANHVKVLAPEPFIDRRGRVRGNWRGLKHLLRGHVDPTEILRSH